MRRRSDIRRGAALLAVALVLAACGGPPATTASGELPTSSLAGGTAALPRSDEFVPPGTDGVTPWVEVDALPQGFDPNAARAEPEGVAEALGSAMAAAFATTGQQADLELTVVSQASDDAVMLITETGIGDDSIFGAQYSLVVRHVREGWFLDELWMRTLCRRGTDASRCV